MISDFKHLNNNINNIYSLFIKNKETLSVAESLTGGLLSHLLSANPGSSAFFLGSVVAYSYSAKDTFLSVSKSLLEKDGAVNKNICLLMAQGIKEKLNSTWSISTTGVAGPGKKAKDPSIGTVFVGVLGPNTKKVKRLSLKEKNREDIQHQSCIFALDFLYSCITMSKQKF